MKCFITVDTEADDQWKSSEVTLRNIDALNLFQDFMEERGVPPTYFVSYEVLEHPYMKELSKKHKEGLAEVGGHLHPWTTPPVDKKDKEVQRFPSELSEEVLGEKLSVLTKKIAEILEEQPKSFRAGKWGFNAAVGEAIAKEGYVFDSSITPGISWADIIKKKEIHKEIPDFTGETLNPRTLSSGVYEVPMSIVKTRIYTGSALDSVLWKKNFIGKVARAFVRPMWCRIFPETTINDLERVYRAAKKQNIPLVFMIHSSELVPGASPYAKDGKAVEHIYSLLDAFIDLLKTESVDIVRLQDIKE